MLHFEIPKNQSSIIKVVGVGGGGSNAVNYMYSLGIEGVDFVVCNTDSQALALSPVPNKIQLGPHLTQGLGAGANPEIGMKASEESIDDITKILNVNTRMAFVTAGMGGGTGTGGAPVLAKICKELGILTVGIVTLPFSYEGKKRMKQAQEGIDRMREYVDTILIISNDKLRQQFGNLPFTKAFAMADDVLATAAKCITDVINTTGQINVDFADVCTVMKNGGVAILGNAAVAGENRALEAVEQALNSPLLNDNDIQGAKWILLNITSTAGEFEHTIDEIDAIQAYMQQQAGDNCDVILGVGHDPNLEDKIGVTIIATGFNHKEIKGELPIKKNEPEKVVMRLGDAVSEGTLNASTTTSLSAEIKSNPLAPVLVEIPEEKNIFSMAPEKVPLSENQDSALKEVFQLKLSETGNESNPTDAESTIPDDAHHTPMIQLTIKHESEINPASTSEVKIGTRVLSPEELEEKEQFENQKKALEERAERLRRMSFNIQEKENHEELEQVPAFVRKNVDVDNNYLPSEKFYSGYTVGFNDEKKEQQASIQTINTFLDGNKPD